MHCLFAEKGEIKAVAQNYLKKNNFKLILFRFVRKIEPQLNSTTRCFYSIWLQGCQIFLVQHTKTGENIPNDHKIAQMDGKFTKWTQYTNISRCKTLQNLPKMGFLVGCHLATLLGFPHPSPASTFL
jgi:hypothetical protein